MNHDESFFREVEEDYRREQLINAAKKYGVYAIAGAFIIIAVVAGYTYEKRRAAAEAARGGDAYSKALLLAEKGKDAEAKKALAEVSKQGSGPYRALARLAEAGDIVEKGKPKDAVAIYRGVSEDGSAPESLRDFAKIQLAALAVDTESYEAIAKQLQAFRAATHPWRFSAKEILGLSAMKHGKNQEAEKLFGEIMSDGEAPQGMRQRAEIMLSLLFEKKAATQTAGEPGNVTSN